jgi:FkbM family methyltransferase
MRFLKGLIRSALERGGYWVTSKAVLPFGVDYLWDIQRLAATHEISIRMFVDIGAHEGQTAIAALSAFPHAYVHSFEPHPISFAHLSRVASKRLSAHRLAMSDSSGPAKFFEYDASESGHASQANSLVPQSQFAASAGHRAKAIEVACTTVDDFCSAHNITSVDVLKIDTEGYELGVLDGAKRLISCRCVRFVFAEYNSILPVGSASGGALAPLAALLEPFGFKLVASYPVYMTQRPLFATFNALFFPPESVENHRGARLVASNQEALEPQR